MSTVFDELVKARERARLSWGPWTVCEPCGDHRRSPADPGAGEVEVGRGVGAGTSVDRPVGWYGAHVLVRGAIRATSVLPTLEAAKQWADAVLHAVGHETFDNDTTETPCQKK